MLANALLAGVVSGIGQGVAGASTTYSTSALGSIATASGSDAFRAGIGTGVGKALDRLAQYYIKLAESTFPVIEVDAGREVDVVVTRGVRVDLPMAPGDAQVPRDRDVPSREPETPDDDAY
jgi:conjugal transfer pilus assembly protein TraB